MKFAGSRTKGSFFFPVLILHVGFGMSDIWFAGQICVPDLSNLWNRVTTQSQSPISPEKEKKKKESKIVYSPGIIDNITNRI